MTYAYDAEGVADLLGLKFIEDRQKVAGRRKSSAAGSKNAKGELTKIGAWSSTAVRPTSSPAKISVMSIRGYQADRLSAESLVRRPSPVLIEWAISRGLPRESLRNVARAYVGPDAKDVAEFERAIVPKATLARNPKHLSQFQSEKVERAARLMAHATRVLGTQDEARAFMSTPHRALGDERPVDLTQTELGAKRVEGILDSIAYGLPR